MARDHRIISNGKRIDFSCENTRYKTDLSKHVADGRPGSVLPFALYSSGEYSLWLEHVIEKKNSKHVYWLMWYKNGIPTIPMSGVLDEAGVLGVVKGMVGVDMKLLNGAV